MTTGKGGGNRDCVREEAGQGTRVKRENKRRKHRRRERVKAKDKEERGKQKERTNI